MNTTVATADPKQDAATTSSGSPDQLTPVLSSKLALGLPHLCLAISLSMLFMLLNYVGLRPTDLWCHVAYGDWILSHQTLPTEDPFMPFSVGVQVTDTAWLSQVILAKLYQLGGPELLSTTFAVTMLTSLIILSRVYYLQSGRVSIAALGLILTVVIGWSRLLTIRPEMFGLLAFSLLLWLVFRLTRGNGVLGNNRAGWPRFAWLLVPFIFALWANLHGSFACGLALLACALLGTAWEVAWRFRSIRAVWRSSAVRRWLILFELALIACLINPYHFDLLINTLLFSGNENLGDVLEWQSLALGGVGGLEFALSVVLLLLVLRHSRRRVRATEVLLLIVFAAAAVSGVRMLSWYGPVVVFVLLPHISEILQRLIPQKSFNVRRSEVDLASSESNLRAPPAPSFKITLACGFVIWTAFALSPTSQPILGGPPRNTEQVHGGQTPLGVTEYLRENPPRGQLWNPQYWGDWIITDGPADVPVFSTTMIHLVPRQVWQDYIRIYHAGHGWSNALERYVVTTTVIDKQRQQTLAGAIRRSQDWQVDYEDDQALIASRRTVQQAIDMPTRAKGGQLAREAKEVRTIEVGVTQP